MYKLFFINRKLFSASGGITTTFKGLPSINKLSREIDIDVVACLVSHFYEISSKLLAMNGEFLHYNDVRAKNVGGWGVVGICSLAMC